MSENHLFGQRLRELREQAGLTQQQLAARAGMHRQGIAKLELGEREPAWSSVRALAQALGVSCAAFEPEAATVAEPAPKRGRPKKTAQNRKDKR